MSQAQSACPTCGFVRATYEPSNLTKTAIFVTRATAPAAVVLALCLAIGWPPLVGAALAAVVGVIVVSRQFFGMRSIAIHADAGAAVYERAGDVTRLPWASTTIRREWKLAYLGMAIRLRSSDESAGRLPYWTQRTMAGFTMADRDVRRSFPQLAQHLQHLGQSPAAGH